MNRDQFAAELLRAKNSYNRNKNANKAMSAFRPLKNSDFMKLVSGLRLSGETMIEPKRFGRWVNAQGRPATRVSVTKNLTNTMKWLNRNAFEDPY
jgi:hypothetical protein